MSQAQDPAESGFVDEGIRGGGEGRGREGGGGGGGTRESRTGDGADCDAPWLPAGFSLLAGT